MSEKLQGGILLDGTDLSLPLILRSTSDNTGVTGKDDTDVTASYWRQGGIRINIPAVTLATADSTHTDGGFVEVDSTNMPGSYRFDVPDTAIASGADWVVISIQVTGAYMFYQMFNLTPDLSLSVADIIAGISEGAFDFQEMMRIIFAVLTGVSNGGGTGTLNFIGEDGSTVRLSATVNELGERTIVSRDGS